MPVIKSKNENFFKKWSRDMAYVLGFLAADGALYINKRGSHYFELQIKDLLVLRKIRKSLGSNHKITLRKKHKRQSQLYRLQIGSKIMFSDLIALGLMPKKAKTMNFPSVPKKFLVDFVRGYFDGDGSVWSGLMHKNRVSASKALRVTFTSGNINFLNNLAVALHAGLKINGVHSYYGNAHRLIYATKPSLVLFKFMYNKPTLYLKRKREIFQKYLLA